MLPTPGLKQGYPFTVCKDVDMVSSTSSLAGRAECTTFPTIQEATMVECLAQGHKCHDRQGVKEKG